MCRFVSQQGKYRIYKERPRGRLRWVFFVTDTDTGDIAYPDMGRTTHTDALVWAEHKRALEGDDGST